MQRADWHKADLAGADLRGSCLAGADLGGTCLREADLREVKLRRGCRKQWPGAARSVRAGQAGGSRTGACEEWICREWT